MDNSEENTLNVGQPKLPQAAGGTFAKGQILGGKYKVIAPLGSGGMGTVYRVQQVFLNKEFALKTLDSQRNSDVAMMRFQVEARAASLLDHPNLVKVYDFGLLDSGEPFLVMDIVRGITLADRLQQDGPLEVQKAGRLFAQISLGLGYAHDKGVVHRDIKPGNIMLVDGLEEGTEGSVKIVDFGIAKLAASEDGSVQALTRTGEVFGSPLYMSPEQCSGAHLDYRSDIYSLGCVMFEALTGAPPHLGQNALTTMMLHQSEPAPSLSEASLGKTFPQAIERIVAKMLNKLPEDRYSKIGLVALDLSAVIGGINTTQSRVVNDGQKKAPKIFSLSRFNLFSLLGAVVICTAIAAGSGGYFLGQSTTQPVPGKVVLKREVKQETPQDMDQFVANVRPVKNEANVHSINSRVEIDHGIAKRIFKFPSTALGMIRWKGANGFESHLAKGDVSAPAGLPITFEIDALKYPAISDDPNVFKKIGETEFSGLTIKGGMTNDAPLTAMEAPTVAAMLKSATTWSALDDIVLHQVPGDRRIISVLNEMQGLRRVRLARLYNLDSDWLARQPFLSRLQEILLTGVNGDAAVRQVGLSHSPKINLLWLQDASVSSEALAELRNCPCLTTLAFSDKNISDDDLKAITQIKSVVWVIVRETKLTNTQIEILTHSPQFKEIEFSQKDYSPREREAIKKFDKRIIFTNEK